MTFQVFSASEPSPSGRRLSGRCRLCQPRRWHVIPVDQDITATTKGIILAVSGSGAPVSRIAIWYTVTRYRFISCSPARTWTTATGALISVVSSRCAPGCITCLTTPCWSRATTQAWRRFRTWADRGLIDLRVVPAVGCEATARIVHDFVKRFVEEQILTVRVWLESVEVREHAGNSAIYTEGRPS